MAVSLIVFKQKCKFLVIYECNLCICKCNSGGDDGPLIRRGKNESFVTFKHSISFSFTELWADKMNRVTFKAFMYILEPAAN